MDIALQILQNAGTVLWYTWWFWAFIILWPLFRGVWLFWRQEAFKHDIDWVLLELRMPREVRKSPMAMEQVFAAVHSLRNAPSDFEEKWINGEVTRWYSFEIVSIGGAVHFYIRAPRGQKNLIEAAIFSYYNDVEIVEVDDYVATMPANYSEVQETGYELWGTEFILAKDSAYPIKSYLDFESPDEDKQYDPISHLLEVLGKVRREEIIGIQLLIEPEGDDWRKHGEHLVDELRTRKGGSHGGSGYSIKTEFPHILPAFPVHTHSDKEESEFTRTFMRTPGETDVLKAVEENISKPGFKTIIRFIYLSPRELFFDTFARRGVIGAFNQYASSDLNAFRQNFDVATSTKVWAWPHIFPKIRNRARKERLLFNFKHRDFPTPNPIAKLLLMKFWNGENSKEVTLTTRSLATIYHPPTFLVLTAPHVQRVESRKGSPPAGLPIYGGEEEIEKYQ